MTQTGVEEVTEKTEKCQKWKLKDNFFSFSGRYRVIPLNCSFDCNSQEHQLLQDITWTKTVQRQKVPKVAGAVNQVWYWRGSWFFCPQCADLSMTF